MSGKCLFRDDFNTLRDENFLVRLPGGKVEQAVFLCIDQEMTRHPENRMMFRNFKFRKGRASGKNMIIQLGQMIRKIDGSEAFTAGKRIVFNRDQLIRKTDMLQAAAFRESFRADLAYRLGEVNRNKSSAGLKTAGTNSFDPFRQPNTAQRLATCKSPVLNDPD